MVLLVLVLSMKLALVLLEPMLVRFVLLALLLQAPFQVLYGVREGLVCGVTAVLRDLP
jgi:hypothetical protein